MAQERQEAEISKPKTEAEGTARVARAPIQDAP